MRSRCVFATYSGPKRHMRAVCGIQAHRSGLQRKRAFQACRRSRALTAKWPNPAKPFLAKPTPAACPQGGFFPFPFHRTDPVVG